MVRTHPTPYVGTRAGMGARATPDEFKIDDSLLLSPYVGMKFWANEKTSLFVEGDYLFFVGGDAGDLMGPDKGIIMVMLGLSVLL